MRLPHRAPPILLTPLAHCLILFSVISALFVFAQATVLRASEQIQATPQDVAQYCEGLTKLGDIYINDGLSSMYLDHSSVCGYLNRERVCGFLVKNEMKYMGKVFNNVKRKLLVIVGGKCTTEKLLSLLDLMKEADDIIIGGALATIFLKVDLGMGVGKNSFDEKSELLTRKVIELASYYKCQLHYPVDLLIANAEDGTNPQLHSITKPIPDGMTAVDVGDLTASMFSRIARKSNVILWTGTVGVAKVEKFAKGSKILLDTIKRMTLDPERRVTSIVCGKSCSLFVQTYNPTQEGITHISTGGTAVIKLLTDRTLKALEYLNYKTPEKMTNILAADSGDFTDQRVLVRADLNLPVDESGQVLDPFPLRQLIPLIKMLQRKGARAITLVGHRGVPNGIPDKKLSLLPLKEALEMVLDQPVVFIPEGVSDVADILIRSQEPGRVLLLENIHFYPEEFGVKEISEGLKVKISYDALNDFRNKFSSLGDIFINEAFDSLHRPDSSVVGLKQKTKFAGLSLKKEIVKYMELRDKLEHPVLAIVGGTEYENVAKIFNMLQFVDELILCGGIAHSYIACEDPLAKLGKTEVDRSCFKDFPKLIRKSKFVGVRIHLPTDFVVAESLLAPPRQEMEGEESAPDEPNFPKTDVVTLHQGVPKNSYAFDIGPNTVQDFQKVIAEAKTIIYIGDAGAYDFEPFGQGTKALLSAIQAAITNEVPATAIALGMQTGVCLGKLNALDNFTHYSTSVQTFVDIMNNRVLPGLVALTPSMDKKIKKLRMDSMDLRGKRVLLRLDLDVPTVEGVVLDTDKIEEALPTIRYVLKMGAKSVVLLGHRGEPHGYKNYYLKMHPLVEELNQLLELEVTLINRPCSHKARNILADPAPGSVFLMENLKFYPAEYGRDPVTAETNEEGGGDETQATGPTITSPEPSKSQEAADDTNDAILSVSDGDGGRNIDAFMFQKMTLKTVAEFKVEIAECGDVFINDDVKDVEQALTSLEGFGLHERGVGFQMIKYLMEADEAAYNLPGVASLSPSL